MKKNKHFKTKISFSVLILIIFFINLSNSPSIKNINYDFGDLKDKSYYSDIFSSDEIKQLAELEEQHNTGKTKNKKTKEYFDKSNGYKLSAEEETNKRKEKKYLKKATKYKKKALKNAFKAYIYLIESTQKQYDIYKAKLKKMQNDGSKEHELARKVSDTANIIFKKGSKLQETADKKDEMKKYESYKKIYNLYKKSIKKQELAFGLYEKDPEIDISKISKTKKSKTDKDKNKKIVKKRINKNKNLYNPDTDTNLYRSKDKIILPKLNLSEQDKNQIDKSNKKITAANELMKIVDKYYIKVDSLRTLASSKLKNTEKNMILQEAETLEMRTFSKMNKAANLYFDANVIKYKIYFKHFAKAKKSKRKSTIKKGRLHEMRADSLYSQAKIIGAQVNLAYNMYASDKYLALMEAKQTILSAIQEQENAYCTYFGLSITPLPAKSNLVIIADDSSNNNKKNTKNGKGKTNSVTKKLTYNYAGSFVYSVKNPVPIVLKHKKGIIFKVQIGLFKRLLSTKSYGLYSPISFDEFKNNPYRRFTVGELRSSEAAEYVLVKIKEKGIKDAYIVGYIDGKRTSYKKTKSKLVIDEKYNKLKEKELAHFTGKPVVTNNKQKNDSLKNKEITKTKSTKIKYGKGKHDFAKGKDVLKTTGLIYGIQIGMFSLPKTNKELKYIKPLLEIKTKKGTKFLKGPYYNYASAKADKTIIIKKGYKNAYIKAFYDGKEISISEGIVRETNKKDKVVVKKQEKKDKVVVKKQEKKDKIVVKKQEKKDKVVVKKQEKKDKVVVKKQEKKDKVVVKKQEKKDKVVVKKQEKKDKIVVKKQEKKDKIVVKKQDAKIKYGKEKYDLAKGEDVLKTTGLIYGIQIGMFSLPKTNYELKEVKPLLEIKTEKGTKFLKGPYYNYSSVKADKSSIIKKGYKNAYIKAFYNGKEISISEAVVKEKNSKIAKIEKKPIIYFTVQIGAFSSEFSLKNNKQFQLISKKYTVHKTKIKDDLVIYTVGNYVELQKTVDLKIELQKNGFPDAFITAFNKNKKIDVNKAKELLKK